ncbi:MAG: thioredoxin family protein [Chloroflexi bacterium]|nr:thioredoxin family protein [Chloroflexota bacterium]
MHFNAARVQRTLFFALLIALLAGLGGTSLARAQSADQPVVTMFWGDGCPHCAEAKPFLEGLKEKYPGMELRLYEVWHNEDNLKMMQQMAEQYGFTATGVPTTFIGDKYWVGFNEQIGAEMEAAIKELTTGSGGEENPGGEVVTLPLFGEVDLQKQSLLVSTLLIALVDGVNPCSIWVLTMLLALTLHTGSRKKVLIIGLIFLTVTAGIYALFITGLFTVLKVLSFTTWIQVVVALVSLFFAIVNIKDYFWYKEGVSFTIDDSKKPGIFQRMRKVLDAGDSFWGTVGATIVLAAGVSLVEFSCTAGFPVMWTNLLTAQNVAPAVFVGLLLVYMLIYQLDELVIFGTAVFSLKASKLEEKHGRILKLIGGVLMLTLAVVMLFNPALMNKLSSSLIIFAIAFALTVLILLLHRKILPAFGIWIGSERDAHRKGGAKKRKH